MTQFRLLLLAGLLIASGTGPAIIKAQDAAVKIGLLIPEQEAIAAKHGAELAIREANEKGGYEGCSFHLVVRSAEGPWGAGSKESVGLVFDDEVVAIMGSLDGRNAHLAEQVATKTKIVFLSAWATDMSLSQAFVPWYFRCVPNDDQQAVTLIQDIYKNRKISRVTVIGTEDYDSRNAVRSFIKAAALLKLAIPRHYMYRSSSEDLKETLQEIERYDTEAIILFGKPSLASEVIPMLQQRKMDQLVFGTLSITDDQRASGPDWNSLEGMCLVSSGHWFTKEGAGFQKTFQEAFGYQPGAAAAYAYDGINLIIEAVKKGGTDRDKIIDAFTEINYKHGVTGEIRFDADGNRLGASEIMCIKNSGPVVIKLDD